MTRAGPARAGQAGAGRVGGLLRAHLRHRTGTRASGWCRSGTATGCPRHASSTAPRCSAGGQRAAGRRPGLHGPVRGRPRRRRASRAGDEVVLFGDGRDGEPTAQDWAEACGTISYEIVTRIGGRFVRRHVSAEGTDGLSEQPSVARARGRRCRRGGWPRSTAGVVVERRVVRSRRAGSTAPTSSAACAATPTTVLTDDGVRLHAEVDEVAPYADGPQDPAGQGLKRLRRPTAPDPTVVFVHGYALNLDCWHFQRQYFRGKHRLVFYDQRSHGRSGAAPTSSTPRSTSSATTCARCSTSWSPRARSCWSVTRWAAWRSWRSPSGTPSCSRTGSSASRWSPRRAGGLKTHHIVSRLDPRLDRRQIGRG